MLGLPFVFKSAGWIGGTCVMCHHWILSRYVENFLLPW